MATPQYGMFGPLPFEVQDQQQAAFRNNALAVAQLDPYQNRAYNAALSGNDIGQGISRALGGEDPAIARAQQLKAISDEVRASGIDPNNFEQFYGTLGEKLAKAGLMKEAASVADALQARKDKQASLEIKQFDAETARIRAEAFRQSKLSKSSIAQEIFKKNKEYAPASLQKYLDSITDEKPNGDLSNLQPYVEPKGWEADGFTPDKRFVFTNKAGQVGVMGPTGEIELYNGPVDKSTKGTNVSVGGSTVEVTTKMPAQDAMGNASASVLEKVRSKQLDELKVAANAARDSLPVLEHMKSLVKSGNLITGTARDARLSLARLAATAGFGSLANKVNDSDFFDSFATEMVLPLMKQLGGSDSNEELKTLTKATANRTMSPAQLKRHLEFLEKKADRVLARDAEFERGINEDGRDDILSFNPVSGKWGDRRIKELNQVGTVEETTSVKTPGPAAAPTKAVKPAVQAQAAKAGLPPPPASLVSKWAATWGISEEEAAAKLIQQRKDKGL